MVQAAAGSPGCDGPGPGAGEGLQGVVVGRADRVGGGHQGPRIGVAMSEQVHDDHAGLSVGPGPGDAPVQGGTPTELGVASRGFSSTHTSEVDGSAGPHQRPKAYR